MRLGDLDALVAYFERLRGPNRIAITDVTAVVDNWPVVRCGRCEHEGWTCYAERVVDEGVAAHIDGCSNFEPKDQPK